VQTRPDWRIQWRQNAPCRQPAGNWRVALLQPLLSGSPGKPGQYPSFISIAMKSIRRSSHLIPSRFAIKLLAVSGVLIAGSLQPAQAGWLDSILGTRPAAVEAVRPGQAGQRVWRIKDFMTVELVAREANSPANQLPMKIDAEALRQLLTPIRVVEQGSTQPLFVADEIAELTAPLQQALALAGPNDDVLLLSSARRGSAVVLAPTAITARLWVQGDSLQLIVHDANLDFYDAYRGNRIVPKWNFGSRATPGTASLQSANARNLRSDWLAMPLQVATAAAATSATTVPLAPVAATPPVVRAVAPAATAVTLPAAAAAATPTATGRDPEAIEQRLLLLKRLHANGLISDDEYQQKRKEILQQL
jgi:hypothetical protein